MKSIPFRIIEYHELYTNQIEGLNITETEDTVIVNICKSFPTPGYFMEVNRVERAGETFIIYLKIIPPRSNAILLQVITYKKNSIEIDKKNLGSPPYKFKVSGGIFQGGGNIRLPKYTLELLDNKSYV